jgi:hypothetical protein
MTCLYSYGLSTSDCTVSLKFGHFLVCKLEFHCFCIDSVEKWTLIGAARFLSLP